MAASATQAGQVNMAIPLNLPWAVPYMPASVSVIPTSPEVSAKLGQITHHMVELNNALCDYKRELGNAISTITQLTNENVALKERVKALEDKIEASSVAQDVNASLEGRVTQLEGATTPEKLLLLAGQVMAANLNGFTDVMFNVLLQEKFDALYASLQGEIQQPMTAQFQRVEALSREVTSLRSALFSQKQVNPLSNPNNPVTRRLNQFEGSLARFIEERDALRREIATVKENCNGSKSAVYSLPTQSGEEIEVAAQSKTPTIRDRAGAEAGSADQSEVAAKRRRRD